LEYLQRKHTLMLYALTFAAGALARSIVDAYMDKRRKERVGAWRDILTGKTDLNHLPLGEVLRLRGVYDQPEV
jgi:hypothetical protein